MCIRDRCAGYPAYDVAQVKRDLDAFCAIGGNLTDPKCSEYDGYDMAVSVADEIDAEILAELCKDSKDADGNTIASADSACRPTGGRCGNSANGGKCFGDACCSHSNWCASTTGGRHTPWCGVRKSDGTYVGTIDGKYDGTASRDEADKIARRPSNFSVTLATRIVARKELDVKCETDTTDSKCKGYTAYDDAQAIRDLVEKCATDINDPNCAGYEAYDVAQTKKDLDAFCPENIADPKCSEYDGHLDAFCPENLWDPKCKDLSLIHISEPTRPY